MKTKDIDQFSGISVKINYQPILDKYGKECLETIKQNVNARKLIKTGKYMAGWTMDDEKDYLGNYSVVVHNATSWQLTHLLENGHLIVNKKGGAGRASPHPHIRPAYRSVRGRFVKAIENVQLDATFE